jgi:DNA-3-methyladenine glycosylase
LEVARDCIGKLLLHRTAEGTVIGRIVEAEAYRGPEDRAAHSWGGRNTPRTQVMFGPPGYAYVFFVYGMHYQFNLVTGAVGEPQAVLIRAIEPVIGLDLMASRRKMSSGRVELTNGPGKVCKAFGISRAQYGADLCSPTLCLLNASPTRVARAPRIGVAYAGTWARKLWRFFEPGNQYVSDARGARRAAAGASQPRSHI